MTSTFRLRPLQAAMLLALAGASPFASALKLSEPTVKSYVGQPLVAEFVIEDSAPEEVRRLKISLARPEAYAAMRTTFHPSLKTSTLTINDSNKDKPVLILTTEGPVEDSVVDIVFELTWAAGKMIQASTVLIDPAPSGVNIDTPSMVSAPVVTPESTLPTLTMKEQKDSDVRMTLNEAPVPATSSAQLYTVKKGDTLTKIIQAKGPTGVKLEQSLIALYNKNSKVIASQNVNLIKEGTVLALPTKQEALAVDAAQAVQTVALHAANFRKYAQSLAGSSSGAAAPRTNKAVSGSLSSEVTETTKPVAPKQDQVKVATGAKGMAGTTAKGKEEIIQSTKAMNEAKERQAALDKNLKELEELTRIKNAQLAKMQEKVTAPKTLMPPPDKGGVAMKAPMSAPVKNAPAVPAAILRPGDLNAAVESAKSATPPVEAGPSVPLVVSPPAKLATTPPEVEVPTLPGSTPETHEVTHKDVATEPGSAATPAPVVSAPVEKPVVKPASKKMTAPVAPVEPASDLEEYLPFAAGGLGILAVLGGFLFNRQRKNKFSKVRSDDFVPSEKPDVSPAAELEKFSLEFPPETVEEAEPSTFHVEPLPSSMDSVLSPLAEVDVQLDFEPSVVVSNRMTFAPAPAPTYEEPATPAFEYTSMGTSEAELPVLTEQAEYTSSVTDVAIDMQWKPLPDMGQVAVDTTPIAEPESSTHELPAFDMNSFDTDAELQALSTEMAGGMPVIEESHASDEAAYPVSLTYDPDEQLGIAKFYLGLQDYRGVWDMIHPLLNSDRDDVRAHANALLDELPADLRTQWLNEKEAA